MQTSVKNCHLVAEIHIGSFKLPRDFGQGQTKKGRDRQRTEKAEDCEAIKRLVPSGLALAILSTLEEREAIMELFARFAEATATGPRPSP